LWRRIVREIVFGNLRVVYGAFVYYWRVQQESAKSKRKSASESTKPPATSEAAAATNGGKVRKIKSQARNIREVCAVVEAIVESGVVATDYARAISCAHDLCAAAGCALRS
jgi:hypothetical protein